MARAIFCGINLRNGLTFFASRNFILNPISLPLNGRVENLLKRVRRGRPRE